MLNKLKQRLFLKKGEWCASSFLLLNTVKQSESSYLASGEQRAVVPQKVNNDQDLLTFVNQWPLNHFPLLPRISHFFAWS